MMKLQAQKKLAVSVSVASFVALTGFLAYGSAARAEYPERTPGTTACDNSLDPQCENPPRAITNEDWRCDNNPGPDCAEPPRVSTTLSEGDQQCLHNQNVVACNNPLRYTVADPEQWPTYFPEPQ